MIIWAVDPGLNGALVVIDGKKISKIVRMPTSPHPTSHILKRKIDTQRLIDAISKLPAPDKAVIELPEAINTNARLTLVSLFHSIGVIEGCISSRCDDIHFVSPRRWQAKYNLISKTKWDSINVANDIFPELNIEYVKDSDISEAALIGHWFLKYSGVFI